MDLASRPIIGWSMSESIDAKLVCAALRSACWQRKTAAGRLVHTDRGSQYASHAYRRLATDFAITRSMSRKGNAWDNAAMESFFKTLKVERIHQVRYDTRAQARLDIVDWIEGFYSRVRMHTAIGFVASVTRERSLLAAGRVPRSTILASSVRATSKYPHTRSSCRAETSGPIVGLSF
jgi:putative transposase